MGATTIEYNGLVWEAADGSKELPSGPLNARTEPSDHSPYFTPIFGGSLAIFFTVNLQCMNLAILTLIVAGFHASIQESSAILRQDHEPCTVRHRPCRAGTLPGVKAMAHLYGTILVLRGAIITRSSCLNS